MRLEKAVLAVITTNKTKIDGGAPIFLCDSKEELENVSKNLEAILDGISHALSEDMQIIVKH
ncbi:hypothetical protein KO561_10405 [Radiobacillus kanasensis]|uniref:capping complex subunit for YIEGIA n=1 Tax=Radiobacillus kanasensis TaxID=2844358 RepID=UPI001E2D5425|nr:hypothetical protein [Radiobacillus kanasensis]UFT97637.1 hypothetical protein KO561_10405 [Radiobacillus kanasensis]